MTHLFGLLRRNRDQAVLIHAVNFLFDRLRAVRRDIKTQGFGESTGVHADEFAARCYEQMASAPPALSTPLSLDLLPPLHPRAPSVALPTHHLLYQCSHRLRMHLPHLLYVLH